MRLTDDEILRKAYLERSEDSLVMELAERLENVLMEIETLKGKK